MCVCIKSLQLCLLFATVWTIAGQPPLLKAFSRQEYWSRVAMPSSKENNGKA